MTIMQVLYVLEVARLESISKAAASLLVSQPALSAQIKHLEEELGCELFHREPQGVSLTASGRAFCEDAKLVAKSWQRLQEGTKLLGNAVCSTIRIGIGARAMVNGMFEAVMEFFEQRPETEVSFVTDVGGDLLDLLERKQIHLAIDRLPLEIPHPERLSVYELLRERQCILLAPNDPRAAADALAIQALNGQAVVSGVEHSLYDESLSHTCWEYGIQVSKIHRADSIDTIMALVHSGKGAALGPASFSRRYAVVAVPVVPRLDIALDLICRKRDRDNPLIRQLVPYLKDRVSLPETERSAG